MPFIALDKNTGDRIDITKLENPRAELKKGEVICQLCEQPMIIRAGTVRRHHFAHYAQCVSDYDHSPESPEHLGAKEAIATHLMETFLEYKEATIDYEVKVPEIMRVADIMVTFPNGWRIVHEIQLSPITVEDLQKRTSDYTKAGLDVVWWLGKSADTEANQNWCLDAFGVVYTLNYHKLRSYLNS